MKQSKTSFKWCISSCWLLNKKFKLYIFILKTFCDTLILWIGELENWRIRFLMSRTGYSISINQTRIGNFLDSVHWVQSSEEQHLGILSGSTLSVSQSWTTSERAQHTTSEKKEKSINYTTLKVVSPNFYYRKSPELPFGIKCREPVSNRIEDNQQIKLLLKQKKKQ